MSFCLNDLQTLAEEVELEQTPCAAIKVTNGELVVAAGPQRQASWSGRCMTTGADVLQLFLL